MTTRSLPPPPALQAFLSQLLAQPTDINHDHTSSLSAIIKHEVNWNNANNDQIIRLLSSSSSFTMELIEPTLIFLRGRSVDESEEKDHQNLMNISQYLYGYKRGTMEFQILATIRFSSFLIRRREDNNLTQHAAHALNHLTKHILSACKYHEGKEGSLRVKDNENTASSSTSTATIGDQLYLYVALLYNIIEPIAGVNQACAMTWRGICGISVAMHQMKLGLEVKERRDCFGNVTYTPLIVKAINRVIILLKEGFQTMSHSNRSRGDENGGDDGDGRSKQQQQQQMKKLLKFFVMRLLQLMPIVQHYITIRSTETTIINDYGTKDINADDGRIHDGDITSIISSLLELRGTIIEREMRKVIGNNGYSSISNSDENLHTVAEMLSHKVDTCIDKLLLRKDVLERHENGNKNGNACGTSDSIPLFQVPIMLLFLRCTYTTSPDGRHARIHTRTNGKIQQQYFWLGKLYTTLHLLEKCRKLILSDRDSTEFHVTGDDFECMLAFCENVLFQSMPKCFEYMTTCNYMGKDASKATETATTTQTGASKMEDYLYTRKAIEEISNTLTVLDKIPLSTGPRARSMRRIHHTILKWLTNVTRNGDVGSRQSKYLVQAHPLARELTLSIVHVYIVCPRNGTNHRGNALIRIMAKLVFDVRTERAHRRNIGILLYRLLKMKHFTNDDETTLSLDESFSMLQSTLESALVQAFEIFIDSIRSRDQTDSLGKRKRSHGTMWATMEGLDEIAPLISAISTSSLLWSKMSSSQRGNLMEDLSSLFPFKATEDITERKRICSVMKKAPDLLHMSLCIIDGGAKHLNQQISKDRQQQSFELLYIGLTQIQVTCYEGLTLFRLVKRIISSSKSFTTKQMQCLGVILRNLSSQKASVRQKFGGAILLSVMSSTFSSRVSEVMKSAVTSCFSSFLSLKMPAIVVLTMSSFQQFATRLSDKNLLLSCVPKSSRILLQARLKDKVYCFLSSMETKVTAKQLFAWRREESALLNSYIISKNLASQNLLSKQTRISITAGSKVIRLRHPNDEGQIAILILPPGKTEYTDFLKWPEEGK